MSWVFSYVFVMTGGGPGQATQVTETYIYQNAFTSDIPWLAAAAATLLLIGVTVVAAAFLVARVRLLAPEAGMIVERGGRLLRQLVLIAFTLSALLPVYVMLSGSLRTQSDFLNHPLGLPTSPRLNAYHTAINNHFPQLAPEQPDPDHRVRRDHARVRVAGRLGALALAVRGP